MYKGHKQPGKWFPQKQRQGLNARWERKMDKLTEWKQREDSCRFSKCQYVLPVPAPGWLQEHPLQSANASPEKHTEPEDLVSQSQALPGSSHGELSSSSLSAVVGRSFPSSPSPSKKGMESTLPDFLARWPVPLSQEVPHNFSDQTHVKRGCCSQHPTRHGPLGSDLPWLEHR